MLNTNIMGYKEQQETFRLLEEISKWEKEHERLLKEDPENVMEILSAENEVKWNNILLNRNMEKRREMGDFD